MGKNGIKLVIAIGLLAIAGVVFAFTSGIIGGGDDAAPAGTPAEQPAELQGASAEEVKEHYNDDDESTQRVSDPIQKPKGRRGI